MRQASAASDSSVRTEVVPTATMWPQRRNSRSTVVRRISKCSVCVAAGVVVLDGKEGAGSDVERHLFELDACGAERRDQFGGEVQSRRRRGHRTFEFGVDGLVARVVDLLAVAVQVGRNRNPSQQFEQLSEREVGLPLEPHDLLAAAGARAVGAQLLRGAVEREVDHERSFLPLFEIAHDTAPCALPLDGEGAFVVGRRVGFEAEDLDAGARRLVHDDACADDLRIVEDQHRPLGQLFAQPVEAALRDRAVAVDEQLGGGAFGQREFGDALVGQVVVELVDVDMAFHVRAVYACKITI